jgi:DNA primase
MVMASIDFRALRREVGLDAVLKLLDFVPVQRRGDQVRGACPIHSPQRAGSRSFSAHLARNAYRCFHCGSSGNQLDLWAAATGQPLYQAAIDLCDKLNHPVPWLLRRDANRKKSAAAS